MSSHLLEDRGRDLLDPVKCKQLYEELLKKKAEIECELNQENGASSLSNSLNLAESDLQASKNLIEKSRGVLEEVHTNLSEIEDIRQQVEGHLDKLHSLESGLQYLKVIQRIEFLSNELQREYKRKDDEQCVTVFANLCEISRNLTGSPAKHLRKYLKETLYYWHNILKEKFSNDFDEILESIKWPFLSANFSFQTPAQATLQKLQLVAEYLLQIEIPSEAVNPSITSALLSDFPPLCLPIYLLVNPLRKRFLYHFYGTRQTNRLDKPEWYFSQVLKWIRDHEQFVVKWIQPVIDKLGLHHIDAKLELIRGFVQLTVEKLNSDLPTLQFDDLTFSHSVDEALVFDKELKEIYSYPDNQPSILAVLTQARVLEKWKSMEKKYATEKMDAMLSSDDPFALLSKDIDDLKITNCADAFVTLLQTIKQRYESLPQPGHRLQFLQLQLDLLDDFRVRLLQIIGAEQGNVVESKIPAIGNTVFYIENVLIDWGTMVHYLNLFYYKSKLENVETSHTVPDDDFDGLTLESDTVFAEPLALYRHMRLDLLTALSDSVILEVKVHTKNYRREYWSMMKVSGDFKSLSLTPSACPFFEVLAKRLHQLQKVLTSKLFTIVWRTVAKNLDDYLMEDLVLDSRFSEGGALQFKYDVIRNLLPLFSQYTERPESYFTQLIESSILLNITKGSALLLRETLLALADATGVEDTRGITLREMGVHSFTPEMSIKILNRRTDITVNRLNVD